jgi:hypothetical protein
MPQKLPQPLSVSVDKFVANGKFMGSTDSSPIVNILPQTSLPSGRAVPTQTAQARPTALLATNHHDIKTQISRAGSAAYVFANVRDLIGGD